MWGSRPVGRTQKVYIFGGMRERWTVTGSAHGRVSPLLPPPVDRNNNWCGTTTGGRVVERTGGRSVGRPGIRPKQRTLHRPPARHPATLYHGPTTDTPVRRARQTDQILSSPKNKRQKKRAKRIWSNNRQIDSRDRKKMSGKEGKEELCV